MQIGLGLNYIIEGQMLVVATMTDLKGSVVCEGLSPDMARFYANALLACADKAEELNGDQDTD